MYIYLSTYLCTGDHSWSSYWFSNKQHYLSIYVCIYTYTYTYCCWCVFPERKLFIKCCPGIINHCLNSCWPKTSTPQTPKRIVLVSSSWYPNFSSPPTHLLHSSYMMYFSWHIGIGIDSFINSCPATISCLTDRKKTKKKIKWRRKERSITTRPLS